MDLRLDGKAAAVAEGLAEIGAGVELQGGEVGVQRQAEDAVLLDTSDIGLEESVDALCAIIAARREELA